MKRIEAINDFVIKFANVNGSGSASANELFSKAVMRMGAPDDFDGCGGGLAPWKDHFTGEKPPRKLSKSAKRRARKQRSEARKLAEKKEA